MEIMILIMLWQNMFSKITGFSYLDELIVLMLGFILLKKIIIRKFVLNIYLAAALGSTLAFFLLGIISILVFNYQNSILYGIVSGFFSLKAFVCFFGIYIWNKENKINDKKMVKLLKWIEIPLIIVGIIMCINQFIEIFDYTGVRFGIKNSAFVFEHSTELACYAVVSLLMSLFIRSTLKIKRSIYRNYLPSIFLVLVAGRYKAACFIILFLIMQFFGCKIKKGNIIYLIVGLPVIIFIAKDQIMYYFSDMTATVRGVLYFYSIKIAIDHFPLGSGFATYGTEFSRRKYSPLYSIYKFDGIQGMNRYNPKFITDTMWPAILGETGVFGLIFVSLFFFSIFKMVKQLINKKDIAIIIQGFLFYILIESIADSIFMSSRGCLILSCCAFCISYFVSCRKQKYYNVGENNV